MARFVPSRGESTGPSNQQNQGLSAQMRYRPAATATENRDRMTKKYHQTKRRTADQADGAN